jgi:hypothetical protein
VLSEKEETLMKGIVVWGFAVTLCALVSIRRRGSRRDLGKGI